MKIVCESCGAKYSIADEKVAGKVFKIRCKKCSEVIVVRGDQPNEDEATRVADINQIAPPQAAADAIWHVVVNGDQQGPFSPGQLAEMLTAGTIDWEAYVWREGFDNWLPARDVEPLVQAITTGSDVGGGDAGGGAAAEAASADPFGAAAAAGGELFGGGASAFAADAAPAAKSARAGGGDLFGQADAGASPFGGGGGEEDDGVVASAPSPRAAAPAAALTGQRNENSVLFSLANLQALATGTPGGGGGGKAAAPMSSGPAKGGMATGEGSGLIDIRALAGAGGASGGGMMGGGAAPAKKESIDDLLSIGSGGSPFAPTLGAPMLAPAKREGGNKGLIIGAGLGVVAIVAVAAVVLVVILNKNPPVVTPPAVAAVAPPAVVPASAPPPAGAVVGAVPPVGTTPPPGTAPSAGTEPPAGAPDRAGGPRRGGNTPRRGGNDAPPVARGNTPPAGGNTQGTAATPRHPGSNSIDDLLGQALNAHPAGGGTTPRPATASGGSDDSSLPEQPGRDQVGAALRAVQSAVAACSMDNQHGQAVTAITVSGSTGRVTNAVVSGAFAGTPIGSCVARAARGARFPRFRNATFSVSFPFRI